MVAGIEDRYQGNLNSKGRIKLLHDDPTNGFK
jgi:hypothetical protein